ncbi:MAG: DUF1592 domain-containing protein [Planctomycetaceae bacterium]|nr:DUF1592 domain-containing protein [Planctomycetaceae bacterium]
MSFRSLVTPLRTPALRVVLQVLVSVTSAHLACAEDFDAARVYEQEVQPLLEKHCYNCHGNGAREGALALDRFKTPAAANSDPELWWQVLKNLRAGVMPPASSSTVSPEEMERITSWIKFGPFGIDPAKPDPGPITVRRLNREEYGNTVRALMGVPFDEKLLFPPDDSGHGFDNVADALTVSPLLLDKYLQAAEQVVGQAVPTETWITPRQDFGGSDFRTADSRRDGNFLNGKKPAIVSRTVSVETAGTYQIDIAIKQHGSFDFDPARYVVTCQIDDQERFSLELGWDENKRTDFQYQEKWEAGEHKFVFELQPVVKEENSDELPEANNDTTVRFQIDSVSIVGPEGTDKRVHPRNYGRFFVLDNPPVDPQQRREYAASTLRAFAARAFRGRVDDVTLNRLTAIAESIYSQPNATFEEGVARAMVAVLASPRFLFRLESTGDVDPGVQFALVDELSLASRLSYFLWSSMPDEELYQLAEAGKLREQLPQQVDRMLKDHRANAFISNFVGQWLRTRDVANANVDPEVVLGFSDEMNELREWFKTRFRSGGRRGFADASPEDRAKFERFREIRDIVGRVDNDLKRSMQQETEQFVEHVLRNDVSMLDLLDCNYTFLNDKLAAHYGIPGVEGSDMRRVELPEGSPRGGVLTQASMLLVTSNPTRTSPVKRGLFILDNILGTPAPPAPAAVPELEASADKFKDHKPTLRELLSVHRESALCASCHARMDPLGLALENFDALGMWRNDDHGVAIEPQGELVTGESFEDIKELKKLLREHHAEDFYRCVTQKLLVFAMGRGVEYSDEHTVDLIVDRLKQSDGKFSVLVHGVVESAPFQMQRVATTIDASDNPGDGR